MKRVKNTSEHRKLGLLIAFYRKQRGITQQQLADIVSIEQQQISRIERGVVGVSLDRIIDIARALGIQVHMLLEFDRIMDDYKD